MLGNKYKHACRYFSNFPDGISKVGNIENTSTSMQSVNSFIELSIKRSKTADVNFTKTVEKNVKIILFYHCICNHHEKYIERSTNMHAVSSVIFLDGLFS